MLPGHEIEPEVRQGFFLDAHPSLAVFGGGARDEMVDERRDFVAPLAQRRDGQRDDVQPVEQILAEPALLHQALEVGVGRGDDADVDGEGVRLAERVDLAGLEEAQQLRLQVETELADLVEKQGAALGGSDETRDGRVRRR